MGRGGLRGVAGRLAGGRARRHTERRGEHQRQGT
jgi:hypothetical protein